MKIVFLFLFSTLLLLTGCDTDTEKLYNGMSLTIGVIGSLPNIQEENITFEKMQLDDLSVRTGESTNHLDAIIIMKESLLEADQEQYVKVYRNSTIPIFFMQSSKAHYPFTNERVDYESIPDIDASIYATGYLGKEIEDEFIEQTWRYYLKDNKENESTVRHVFSEIFSRIESLTVQ